MGASLSFDSRPLELAELLRLKPSGTVAASPYRSNIKVWRFYVDHPPLDVRCAAVQPAAFTGFDTAQCYILLHIYRRCDKAAQPGAKTASSGTSAHSIPAVGAKSVADLAESSARVFTPRGLSNPFSGYEDCGPYPFESSEAAQGLAYDASTEKPAPLAHDIYIWNGKGALALTKAVALTKCFELERFLLNDSAGAVRNLHSGAGSELLPAEQLFGSNVTSNGTAMLLDVEEPLSHNHLLNLLVAHVGAPAIECSSLLSVGGLGGRSSSSAMATDGDPPTGTNGPPASHGAQTPASPTSIKPPAVSTPFKLPLGSLVAPSVDDAEVEANAAAANDEQDSPPSPKVAIPKIGLARMKGPAPPPAEAQTAKSSSPTVSKLKLGSGAAKPSGSPTMSKLRLGSLSAPASGAAPAASSPTIPQLNVGSGGAAAKTSSSATNGGGGMTMPKLGLSALSKPKPTAEEKDGAETPRGQTRPARPGSANPSGERASGAATPAFSIGLKQVERMREAGGIAEDEHESRASKLRRFDVICSRIDEAIYLGSDTVARDLKKLRECGITHVLNTAGVACRNYHEDAFTYLTMYLYDSPRQDIATSIYAAVCFIDDALSSGGKVYVHCHQGVSRSSSMVIAYLMWSRRLPFEDAFKLVKEKRGVANPNAGFLARLIEFGNRVNGKSTSGARLHRIVPWYIAPLATSVDKKVSSEQLDPRSVFVLQKEQILYMWIGSRSTEEFVAAAHLWVAQQQRIERFTADVRIEKQDSESTGFWEALGGKGPVSRQAYYDEDYGVGKGPLLEPPVIEQNLPSGKALDVPLRNPHSRPLETPRGGAGADGMPALREDPLPTPRGLMPDRRSSSEAASPTAAPKTPLAELFEYPEWEALTMFDSDDLADDGLFALLAHGRATPLGGSAAKQVFIWVGNETDHDVDPLTAGREFLQAKGLPASLAVSIVRQGQEDSHFWSYFLDG